MISERGGAGNCRSVDCQFDQHSLGDVVVFVTGVWSLLVKARW